MKRVFTAVLAVCIGGLSVGTVAQPDNSLEKRVFKLKYQPSCVDNYSYKVFYVSNGKVYNLMNFALAERLKNASQMACQPGGATCAVLVRQGESELKKKFKQLKNKGAVQESKVQSWIEVYDAESTNKTVAPVKDGTDMLSICYSPDGKSLAVGTSTGEIKFYDTKQYQPYVSLTAGIAPGMLALSETNYYAAVASGTGVEVWNLESKTLRTSLQAAAEITSIAFSGDNSMLAVLSSDGNVNVYETRGFTLRYSFSGLGSGVSCYFHPDNKYLGVVTDANTIVLQNILNTSDRVEVKSLNGGVTNVRFVRDIKDDRKSFMLYPSGMGVVLQALSGLSANNLQALTTSVNERMNEWMKMMDGESMDDYRIRVNDETRAKQQLAFEREVATEMAGDMIAAQTVKLGNYNSQKSLLAVEFDGMPSIALDIPKTEVASFGNGADLSFSNTVYGVNENDQFEVIYTEVLNAKTGKKYVYDNLDRKSVTAMSVDEGFVPLDLVKQSSMEEMKLRDIRKQVVETAQKENKITDKTQINVNTEVLSDVDAAGNRIMNYKVSYGYEVKRSIPHARTSLRDVTRPPRAMPPCRCLRL